ncbi:ABC transporter substrate-binding protein [Ponticaulis sp.]|uniref:ABC transporter substrate-binding protein n=1 Tax=Ponticaulis sp. TaxID=2020902 RepID=UPI000B66E9EE|nr:ABC transporter substrate-binding protein [Ponticaulis sp.]MAI91823.1 iron ABC transporter substrate-binding protein [Ponticaulis sp.]OUX96694.1 MAG: hypothetical protein CBB65_15440 [Hyphomonadaceae bacterium TMED5]|tara:strand:+ start:22910 stop:23749 length:840 start_codon:yes stop_codon:yes gene_type:complete
MKQLLIPVLALLAACSSQDDTGVSAPSSDTGYRRIVSMDYCADQYVLALADRADIVALSPDADKNFSYLRTEAEGIAQVRPVAESVLALQPDLIVRSYGGGPMAPRFFEQAGIPVLQIGWTNDFDSIRDVTRQVAAEMGRPERGEALVTDFNDRLNAVLPRLETASALYVTPGGVTSGHGSLIDDMFTTAGLENYVSRPGWHDLPLERLAREEPDVLAVAFYETIHRTPSVWSPSRHPITQSAMEHADIVPLDASWTSCGAWYIVEAIEALAEGEQVTQ